MINRWQKCVWWGETSTALRCVLSFYFLICVCMCVSRVCSACGGQKGASDYLALELQTVVNHQPSGARNWTWVLACVTAHARARKEVRRQLTEVLSFHHVTAKGQTQIIRLDGKCLDSMSLHQDGCVCGGGCTWICFWDAVSLCSFDWLVIIYVDNVGLYKSYSK